jgi:hypothetical protein
MSDAIKQTLGEFEMFDENHGDSGNAEKERKDPL